jgi:undecaprenyl diphosphate synthase
VDSLFWLLRAYLRMEAERLRQNGVRLEIIGRRDRLDNLLLREISRAEEITAEGQRLHLRIAVDYSSRDAITRAAAAMVVTPSSDRPTSSDLLRPMLAHALSAESGEVDLLIRTGGEKRLSDFLLWESAYAELLFTDQTWPDFDAADLDGALAEFERRERRFGSVPAATTGSQTGGANDDDHPGLASP